MKPGLLIISSTASLKYFRVVALETAKRDINSRVPISLTLKSILFWYVGLFLTLSLFSPNIRRGLHNQSKWDSVYNRHLETDNENFLQDRQFPHKTRLSKVYTNFVPSKMIHVKRSNFIECDS